ncbi:MAG: RNA polymerase sigma factor, partial [Actinomycetia bacterium]|nr:RNA polymerase sigma factor [Actinomycetes bacterium]
AVRAHLLELTGDRDLARAAYIDAAGNTTSSAQQRYLYLRANRLS